MAIAAIATSSGCGRNAAARSIEVVLKADAVTTQGAKSVTDVVNNMRSIDLTNCPNDFRVAYVTHIHAWEALAAVEQKAISLESDANSGAAMAESFIRGFFGDPFGKSAELFAAQTQLQRDAQAASLSIKQTFETVEVIAVGHGAKMPPRKAPQT